MQTHAPSNAKNDRAETSGRLASALGRFRTPPWRTAAKVLLSGIVIFGLAWVGARNAASGPPPALASASAVAVGPPTATSPSRDPGASSATGAGSAEAPAAGGRAGILLDGRVVLNLATEEDLRTLRGIGPSRASKILELRTRMGKFRSVRDLLRVRGIGVKTLERLKPKLVVDPPPAATNAGT